MEARFRLSHTFYLPHNEAQQADLEYYKALKVPLGELLADDGCNEAPYRSKLEAILSETGTKLGSVHTAFGRPYDFSVVDEEARKHALEVVLQAIPLALDYGAKLLVVHGSAEPIEETERSARFANAKAGLRAIVEAAGEAGLKVALELLPRTCLGNTPEELFALVEGLDEAVCGICFDSNHSPTVARVIEDFEALKERIIHLHISDFDGTERHWMPYLGRIDWHYFINRLVELGYEGIFDYETKAPGRTPEEQALILKYNYLRLLGEAQLEPNALDRAALPL